MNETKMLIASLSDDLFRVATFAQRGSKSASSRFTQEAKKWAVPLLKQDLPKYIEKIVKDVASSGNLISIERAEVYMMYGILLQNYSGLLE